MIKQGGPRGKQTQNWRRREREGKGWTHSGKKAKKETVGGRRESGGLLQENQFCFRRTFILAFAHFAE